MNVIALLVLITLGLDTIIFGWMAKGMMDYDKKPYPYVIFFAICTIFCFILTWMVGVNLWPMIMGM